METIGRVQGLHSSQNPGANSMNRAPDAVLCVVVVHLRCFNPTVQQKGSSFKVRGFRGFGVVAKSLRIVCRLQASVYVRRPEMLARRLAYQVCLQCRPVNFKPPAPEAVNPQGTKRPQASP